MNEKRGYAKIEIGGKLRPVRFSLNTITTFEREAGVSIGEVEFGDPRKMKMDHLRSLIWAGFVEGYATDGKEVDFTLRDVGDWIEGMGLNGLADIFKIIRESMPKPTGKSGSQKKSPSK